MTNAKFDERLAPASTARPDWRHLELQTEQPLFTDPQRRLRRRLQRRQRLGYMRESVAVVRSVPHLSDSVTVVEPELDGFGAFTCFEHLFVTGVVHLFEET